MAFVAGSVALGFFVAFILAWLVERTDLRWRATIFTTVLFPLMVPGVVLGIAWTFLLGPHAGWLNLALRALFRLDGDGPLNIFSMGGLILAQGAALVPFLFVLLSAALRAMNPALEEASAPGATPLATFWRVTLPVLRPGLLAPLILATLVALEQFEMPLIIGLPARIDIFSTRIYYELNPDTNLPAFGRAAAVALPFLAAAMALLLLYNRLVRRAERFVTVTGKAYRPARLRLGRWTAPALAFVALYLGFAVVLPAAVLLWTSIFGFELPSLALLSRASLGSYRSLLARADLWLAVRNTFVVAGASAAIVTALGALVAWTVLRSRLPGRGLLDVVSILSIGIPSVIAGLATMLLYLSLPIGIYGTVGVLVLAYSYRLAVSTRLSRASLTQLHRELEEAATVAGGRWLTTIGRVVVPLLRPTLAANFVLLFIIGFLRVHPADAPREPRQSVAERDDVEPLRRQRERRRGRGRLPDRRLRGAGHFPRPPARAGGVESGRNSFSPAAPARARTRCRESTSRRSRAYRRWRWSSTGRRTGSSGRVSH